MADVGNVDAEFIMAVFEFCDGNGIVQVDRLTMSCEMLINPQGQVVEHEIFQSVIKTTERMTYSDVNKILVDDDEELKQKD